MNQIALCGVCVCVCVELGESDSSVCVCVCVCVFGCTQSQPYVMIKNSSWLETDSSVRLATY